MNPEKSKWQIRWEKELEEIKEWEESKTDMDYLEWLLVKYSEAQNEEVGE